MQEKEKNTQQDANEWNALFPTGDTKPTEENNLHADSIKEAEVPETIKTEEQNDEQKEAHPEFSPPEVRPTQPDTSQPPASFNETPSMQQPPLQLLPSAQQDQTQEIPQPKKEQPGSASAVGVVLQWLTYGLWTGTLTALGVLLSGALAYYILDDTEDYTFLIYVLAVTLCLLPLAYLADKIFSKHEPEHKHGFAAVIMVIHAVIAFLVGLGALITAVVTTLSIAVDAGPMDEKFVVIGSALIIALLGTLFFIRVLRPRRLNVINKYFPLIVALITGATVILALAGPFKSSIDSRDDRLIEAGLPEVNTAIQTYAQKNEELPDNLKELTFASYQDDAKLLVERDLVRYQVIKDEPVRIQPMELGDKPSQQQKELESMIYPYPDHGRTMHYELCVTYKNAKNDGGEYYYKPYGKGRQSHISTYSHDAGEQCYDMEAYTY